MEPSRLLPERTPKYLELMYDSDSAQGTICDGYEIPRAPITYMPPFSRHSIVGVAPNRLIKPPLYRTHSLRTQSRPPNATIIPLRNGLVKRASLCEEIRARDPRPTSSREQPRVDLDFDKHVFKTPFWTVILGKNNYAIIICKFSTEWGYCFRIKWIFNIIYFV